MIVPGIRETGLRLQSGRRAFATRNPCASALLLLLDHDQRDSKQHRISSTEFSVGTGVFPVDFVHDCETARRRINAWVEEQTSNKIKELVGEADVSSLTRLVLTNALYFKGEWETVFRETWTREEAFAVPGGASVRVPLMYEPSLGNAAYGAVNGDGSWFDTPMFLSEKGKGSEHQDYYPDDWGFTVLELPYKGRELSMVVLLPRRDDGLPALEELVTPTNLRSWLSSLERRHVHTYLPKFRLETRYLLNDALRAMGILRAFAEPGQPDGAELGGITESQDPRKQIFISLVLHKAFVEVNEKGTEAAAATAVMAPLSAEIEPARPFTPVFRADRPFLFLIRDRVTGTILFLGRVTNPKA